MKLTFFVAFLLLFNNVITSAQGKMKLRTYYYVATDTLNARAEAGFDGEILKTFRKGDSLMLLKEGKKVTVKGKKGRWVDVGYQAGNSERRAVVFSGSLSSKRPR